MEYKGLSEEEARELLKKYGKNRIRRERKVSALQIFLAQFSSPIILLLIAAALVSLAIGSMRGGDYFDSILILAIVFASAIAGFVQDYKAERTVEALEKMAAPTARVIREGVEKVILAEDVVPGDVIVLEGGDIVPADAEILEGEVQVDESMLTGESRAVRKGKGEKVYAGTFVYAGRCVARVYATGMRTEMGKIAQKMQEIREEKTPFQRQMEKFARQLVYMTVGIIVVMFAVGYVKFGIVESFLLAVSLAVAAIPEDLPAVITIALSLGARDMAKQNALVRRLAVTESVGAVDVICTDKTGTLTLGKMRVVELWFPRRDERAEDLAKKIMFYCNNAKKVMRGGEEVWAGDETDVALMEYARRFVVAEGKRIEEIPFSSERKMMSVVHELPEGRYVFTKGAPEVVLERCSRVLVGERVVELDAHLRKEILERNDEFASRGGRVLALAFKEYAEPVEEGLVFVGLVVLQDPPRPEVPEAIRECKQAGIRVIMITGDNPKTALAVARIVGIETRGVVTGKELDEMDDEELRHALESGVNVFARTSPYHKLRILDVLQKAGHTVAMTGDGVNDALALKKADVGIAMGIKGTEVAKEASDIILLDDNFASIRNAVKEGRRIFDNIRKFVDYLLTCNVAEVLVVLLTTLGLPFISLYPAQILWINLLTDGLPALALSVDPPRPDVMRRKPRPKGESVVNRKLAALIGAIGTKKALVILATFLFVLPRGIEVARTVLFTAFILYEFVRIAVIRYNEGMLHPKYLLANKFLVLALAGSLLLQIALIYTPLGTYFHVVPIGLYEWGVLLAGTIVGFVLGIAIAKIVNKVVPEVY